MEYADDDGQIYGMVTRALGDRNFTVKCADNVERRCRCRIRSKTLKNDYVGVIVIVSLRDFDKKSGDIIHVYDAHEARKLKADNHIPEWGAAGGGVGELEQDEEDAFVFEDI